MKALKKIKIINWHYFWNQTISVEPIVFLTGVNASGKSTLIDALQVVLLGETSGRSFNKAAMDKSARTLKGYLKGELADTEDGYKYLRDGRFSSHIALEFYDDVHDESFTVGIVFDIYEDGSEEHRYFLLNAAIPPNEFIGENNVPFDYKTLLEYFKTNYTNKYKFFDSNRQYQDEIKSRFGGLKEKFFTLFKKAVSFNPITDITTFITEYICDPQSNINIETMQENIVQYKRLEKEALSMEGRIKQIEAIEHAFKTYESHSRDIKLFSYLISRSDCELELQKESAFNERRERSAARLLDIDQNLLAISQSVNDLTAKKIGVIENRANSSDYQLSDDLRKQKESASKKLGELNNQIHNVKTNLDRYFKEYVGGANKVLHILDGLDLSEMEASEEEIIKALEIKAREVIDASNNLYDVLENHPEKIDTYLLNAWKNTLNDFKRIVGNVNVTLAKTKSSLERKLLNLKQHHTSLQSGQKSHDSIVDNIKRSLQEELNKTHGTHIDVHFFADLFDIKTDLWVNAMEGYLNTNRFSLFVEPRYYFKAFELLKEIQRRYNYYSSNLIDQEKLIDYDARVQPNSLAEEVITDHRGAQAYANYLIGRLMKCHNVNDLRNSGNGITPQGEVYRNFALSYINPRIYQEHFIGRKVEAREILLKQSAIVKATELLAKYKELHDVISEVSVLDVINTNEIIQSLQALNQIGELTGLRENVAYFDKELQKHDLSEVDTLEHQLKLIDEDLHDLEVQRANLYQEKGNIETMIKSIDEEKLPACRITIKKHQDTLAEIDPFFAEEEGAPVYQKLVDEGKSAAEIFAMYNTLLANAQYRSTTTFQEVTRLRREYVHDYHLSYDINDRSNTVFANELIDLRDVKLPSYRIKIHDAYEKAVREFKDDFIAKLRSSIDAVEDQIVELNMALVEPRFGNDKYQFSVRPALQYRTYYDMIKDDILLSDGGEEFETKYGDVMQDLFRQIASSGEYSKESEVMSNVMHFTDYRSYLDFDLIVTNEHGEEQRLSKMIKKKSGGETQTPFYIAMLASFSQLYRLKANQPENENNSIRLIIFDEAFSKMDSGRVRESIRLLRSLGLQAVVSAPSDKVPDISELVDETLVVLRADRQSYVKLYRAEDEQK